MRSRPNKRNKDLWCHFHNNHGHTTDNCGSLKRAIEAFIKRGQLRKFVAHKEGGQQVPPAMEERKDREENAGTINTISGGLAVGDSKDVKTPHDDPLVITIKAENFEVKRVLVDNESSAEVLFYEAFKKMNISTDRLRKMDTPLYGFSNHPVAVEEHGIGEVKEDQTTARQCYMTSCLSKNKEALIIEDLREHMKIQRGEPVEDLANIKVSKVLQDVETRYLKIDKIAVALIISARRLRPYFQSHTIVVLTDQPLRKVLSSPEASGRLVNWSIELGEFDFQYKPRTAIKAQALADFIVECTLPEDPPQFVIYEVPDPWNLYVDGSSAVGSSGAGIVLISPEGFEVEYALHFGF
ncbi:hypothetical protein RJ639_043535 [Escallonia herrerae]|uniref:Reverse transcriptase RNase H-like domain-containing protein n=1 Tax=Escallonia herrerae TaxID=1293975 RepID=A0AA89B486_9ASTE|nr:hypothetical protein RJ639_043535 [Escallonia herrerae]